MNETTPDDQIDYWKNPDDGKNQPRMYLKPIAWLRSVHLYQVIKDLIPAKENPSILELGSGVGRNLFVLYCGGYQNLQGVDISKSSISYMNKVFPILQHDCVTNCRIEKSLFLMHNNEYDIIYTMAVLQHIVPMSEFIFEEMARVTKKYLITIEDEKRYGPRHFPRRYDRIFRSLELHGDYKMKQIKVVKNFEGLSSNFVARIFKKEYATIH